MVDFIKENATIQNGVYQPCLKQSVFAMLETSCGTKVFGSNKMMNTEVTECPRELQGYVSGAGYHLCKEVCQQQAHAEVDAINSAKDQGLDISGAKLSLVGHTYCCDGCLGDMTLHGIDTVVIYDDNNNIIDTLNLLD